MLAAPKRHKKCREPRLRARPGNRGCRYWELHAHEMHVLGARGIGAQLIGEQADSPAMAGTNTRSPAEASVSRRRGRPSMCASAQRAHMRAAGDNFEPSLGAAAHRKRAVGPSCSASVAVNVSVSPSWPRL